MSAYAAWTHPQLAAQVLRPRRDGCSEIALRVESLNDARQVLWLEQRIRALPGVRRVAIDRPARRVRVVWDAQRTSLPGLLDSFAAANCPAQPLQHDSIDDARSHEQHDALKRLLVAGMCSMQVMTYAFVIYIGVVDFVDFSTRNLFRWLGLLTTLPVVFYSAQPFFRGAMRELGERRLGINLPVALAVGLVFLASTFNTLRGSGEIYFDSVTMFVFLLLGGRYVELRSRHRSGALGDAAWMVREEAAQTIGKLRLAPAVGELVQAMADDYWQVRVKAARALGLLKAAAALPALVEALQHPVSNLRKEAAIALGEIGDTRAIAPLEAALADPDPDVRKLARLALTAISMQAKE